MMVNAIESLYALIVRVLIEFFLFIIPGAAGWWEKSVWSKAITAGGCFLAAVVMWCLVCPLGWLDIPSLYNPGCDTQGFILDVLYKAFLAFMLNFGAEGALRSARRRVHRLVKND
jgi:hypothetical protein